MDYKYFMGIDMAKKSFHYCIYHHHKMASWQVDNNKQGLRQLEKLLKDFKINTKDQALFCLEHTGIYNHNLLEWIVKKAYHLWLESPLAIKKSLGIQRGKNDQVDAQGYYYDRHQGLREHLASFVLAYNHAKRLKTLKGLTPYEYILAIGEQERARFTTNPSHFILEPDT